MTKPLAVPDSAFDLSDFTIRYEPDPHELAHLPSEARSLLLRLSTAASRLDASALRQAERAVEKYPDVPQFKNYLAVLYEAVGNGEQSAALIEQTAELHPDYLFARVNKLLHLLDTDAYAAADTYLKQVGGYDLHDWYPGRTIFNVTELRAFYRALALYAASFNDPPTARRYLRVYRSLEVEQADYEDLKDQLNQYQLAGNMARMNERMRYERVLDGRFGADDEQTEQPPIFHHPEVSALYDYGPPLPDSVREQLLTLPADTLRADLEAIVLDAVRRYRWFSETRDEWAEEEQTFPVHGLMLLRERADAHSLPVVLTLLRQGSEFLEYWFGDDIETVFVPVLRVLGERQWAAFDAFLREPDLYWVSRNAVLEAVQETARHQPERRPEARALVGDLLRFFYEHRTDPTRLDTFVMADLAFMVVALDAPELLPLVETCYAEGLVAEGVHGDFAHLLAIREKTERSYLKKPHPAASAMEIYAVMRGESKGPDYEEKMDSQAMLEEVLEKNSFDLDDDNAFFARLKKPAPPAVPALGRNDKVSVRYPDGQVLTDVKFKKVEDDLKRGKCLLIS